MMLCLGLSRRLGRRLRGSRGGVLTGSARSYGVLFMGRVIMGHQMGSVGESSYFTVSDALVNGRRQEARTRVSVPCKMFARSVDSPPSVHVFRCLACVGRDLFEVSLAFPIPNRLVVTREENVREGPRRQILLLPANIPFRTDPMSSHGRLHQTPSLASPSSY